MRRIPLLAIAASLMALSFMAGRTSAGGVAPDFTFVKDPDGVSWMVVHDTLIGLPYYPVPDDYWGQLEKSRLWAVPDSGRGVTVGECPSWYMYVCDRFHDVRGPLVDEVLEVVDDDGQQPVGPMVIERQAAPTATATRTPPRTPPTPTRPAAQR